MLASRPILRKDFPAVGAGREEAGGLGDGVKPDGKGEACR